jgi:type IV pilus assembly protein PilM
MRLRVKGHPADGKSDPGRKFGRLSADLDLQMPKLSKPTLSKIDLPKLRKPTLGMPEMGRIDLPKLRKTKAGGSLVGLEIEADSIAVAEVRNGSEIVTTAVTPLPAGAFEDGEIVNGGAVTAALRSTFSEFGLSKRVRLGIANQRVVVRTLRLPAIEDPKELEAAVRFQAEEEIPMPIDQAILDHRVVGGAPPTEDGPASVDVVVVAARRDMISTFLKSLRDAGLDPVGVDLSAFGMIRALGEAPLPPSEDGPVLGTTSLYCNIADTTNLAVARGRSCLFTRASPVGLEETVTGLGASAGLTSAHARLWLSHVGLTEPVEAIDGNLGTVAEVRTALEGFASTLVDELRLSLDFYGALGDATPVERIILSGPGAAVPGLSERMSPALGRPIEIGRPSALASLAPAEAARLTVSYGLALEE